MQSDLSDEEDYVGVTNKKRKKTEKVQRSAKFSLSWLDVLEFKSWLKHVKSKKDGSEVAFSKICQCEMYPHKNIFKRHMNSGKHKNLENVISSNETMKHFVVENTASKRAEMLTEH